MIKKLIILVSIFFSLNCTTIFAAADFNQNLYYGLKNNSEVKRLQEFLTDQKVYSGPVTGNFFSLTREGVKKFQVQNGIAPSAGYFGPKSRAVAGQLTTKTVPKITPEDHLKDLLMQVQALQEQLKILQSQQQTATSVPIIAAPIPAPIVAASTPASPLESSLRLTFTLPSSTLSSYGEKLLTEFRLTTDASEKIAVTRIRFKNLATYPLADAYLVTLKLVNSATNVVLATADTLINGAVEFKMIPDASKPDKNVMVSGNIYYVSATIITPSSGAEKPRIRLDVESFSDITAVDFNDFNRSATITKNNIFPLVGPTISTF